MSSPKYYRKWVRTHLKKIHATGKHNENIKLFHTENEMILQMHEMKTEKEGKRKKNKIKV